MINWPDARRRRSLGRRTTWAALLVSALAIPASIHPTMAPSNNAEQDERRWIGTWATAPQPFLPGTLRTFRNRTLRLIVRTSAGGTRVRIRISNAFGDGPLTIGRARI